jgi:hypothetical protein
VSTAVQVHSGSAPVEGPGTALATVANPGAVARGAIGLMRPIAPAAELMLAQKQVREYVKEILTSGTDYAVIPGTERQGKAKPSLMKAGAEKVALGFGLTPEFTIVEQTIDHTGEYPWVKRKWEWHPTIRGKKEWSEEKGVSLGLYRFVVRCDLRHRESGVVVASCIGVCSTMESKYCDRPRECENTALKMAQKRAFVGAALHAAGLSDEFTQDVEDFKDGANRGDGDSESDDDRRAGSASSSAAPATDEPEAACPKCSGKMWDNRARKSNPKAPDFKCRDRSCDGVLWPGQWPPKPKDEGQAELPIDGSAAARESAKASEPAAEPARRPKSAAEKLFPRSHRFPKLAGKPLGEISTPDLADALAYSRTQGKSALADAISEVLAERGDDASPPAPAPVDDDDLPF